MNKTKIEWVKNPDGTQGYTWNPITGCLNHLGGLCKGGGFPCYAYGLAHGRLKPVYLANETIAEPNPELDFWMGKDGIYTDPFYPRLWPKRMIEQFGDYGIPKGIFVCDMGELFGDWIPQEWVARLFERISKPWYQEHRFYFLTKQPQNLAKWSPFPDNCWVGVTACNFKMFGEALFYLSDVEAKVKYISFEPLLGEIVSSQAGGYNQDCLKNLDWLIIGAQTKPYKPPRKEWVDEIVEAADRVGIPVFLKDNLRPVLVNVYGNHIPMRQELPSPPDYT